MKLFRPSQLPLSVQAPRKTEVRTQFSALCYRVSRGQTEVLMITSRRSKRWIIPKGWPIKGKTPAQSALHEAWEEAGVRGDASDYCLGVYSYVKTSGPKRPLHCVAMVYPVRVRALSRDFPESDERRRKWFPAKKAAARVDEPELARILKTFDARRLRS
ncbi:NUDIX hydrolase [Thalassovita taeanensis]|uniref:8-oxo-dGTP pyrophosphatase MutT, NUDIX family n=1 Tax=Thalassovita taeanensis TaxID=657014 RepID=A0A1H9A7H9_9RHOB|nr:NUDIX hydrolase [Thalassovita taeanensis]SEP72696.1 8-oxo-dGTP pyrophosphatase MutT, NUDIX family [Thalassovita taeanensis]